MKRSDFSLKAGNLELLRKEVIRVSAEFTSISNFREELPIPLSPKVPLGTSEDSRFLDALYKKLRAEAKYRKASQELDDELLTSGSMLED